MLEYNSYCFRTIKLVSVLLAAWEPIVPVLTVERFQNVHIQELTTNVSTEGRREHTRLLLMLASSKPGGPSLVPTVHWYCEQRAGSSPQALAGVAPTSSAHLVVRQNQGEELKGQSLCLKVWDMDSQTHLDRGAEFLTISKSVAKRKTRKEKARGGAIV